MSITIPTTIAAPFLVNGVFNAPLPAAWVKTRYLVGGGSHGLALNVAGTRLYACTTNPNTIVGWNVTGGSLDQIPGAPWSGIVGGDPHQLVRHPTQDWFYAPDYTGNNVAGFTLDENGAPVAMPGSFWSCGAGPHALCIDRSGSYGYVACSQDGTIHGYPIGNGGVLGTLAGSPWTLSPSGGPWVCTCNPTYDALYVGTVGGSAGTYSFAINPTTGALSARDSGIGPTEQRGVIASATGAYVYFASGADGTLCCYSAGSDAHLTEIDGSPVSSGAESLWGLCLMPDGAHVLATDNHLGAVLVLAVSPDSGILQQVPNSPIIVQQQPEAVVVTPDSENIYTCSYNFPSVALVHGYTPL